MAQVVHLTAMVGTSGQIGLRGNVPWATNPEILDMVSEFSKRVFEQCHDAIWVAGPKTMPSLVAVRSIMQVSPEMFSVSARDGLDPQEFLDMLDEQYPDRDVWIMGGESTFRLFMPWVNQFHVTVVPYSGPADKYLPDIFPARRKANMI